MARTICTVLCVLVAACSAAAGFEYKTKHYRIQTDHGEEYARLVGRHMEEIFAEYSRRLGRFGKVQDRFDIAVYSERGDYMARMPRGAENSGGAFIPQMSLLATFSEGRTTEDVLRTLYHEGLHQFVFNVVSPNCPIWLNEGMAEYFSKVSWNGRRFETGQVPTLDLRTIQAAVRADAYVSFERLFKTTPRQWQETMNAGGQGAAVQYSQVWSIIHFLVKARDGRYVKHLERYVELVADEKDPEEAFERVFGDDVESFEAAWKRYVLALEPSPEYMCRDNMRAIMVLGASMNGGAEKFRSMADLYEKAVTSGRYTWSVTLPAVGRVSSRDQDKARAMFRCPADDGGGRTSYVLTHPRDRNTPALVCLHHPGIVLVASYMPNPDGGHRVQVEAMVRQTVPAPLQRAIRQALR